MCNACVGVALNIGGGEVANPRTPPLDTALVCYLKKILNILLIMQESSRSHAVFTIIVEHAEYDTLGESIVTIGKLRMVDLAGSERYVFALYCDTEFRWSLIL